MGEYLGNGTSVMFGAGRAMTQICHPLNGRSPKRPTAYTVAMVLVRMEESERLQRKLSGFSVICCLLVRDINYSIWSGTSVFIGGENETDESQTVLERFDRRCHDV